MYAHQLFIDFRKPYNPVRSEVFYNLSISTKLDVCVCPGITLERQEQFQPNLVHIFLYVCVRILCMFYIYSAGRMVWEAGNLDDYHC
jgi:hypothetical protein